MASMEHSGHTRTIPPELAILVLLAAFATGLILAWPWNWQ